jgi:hypothetical protein
MCEAKSEDLVEGDSAEGVPEEEGADEEAGNGLVKIAAAPGWSCGYGVHRDTGPDNGRESLIRERERDPLR